MNDLLTPDVLAQMIARNFGLSRTLELGYPETALTQALLALGVDTTRFSSITIPNQTHPAYSPSSALLPFSDNEFDLIVASHFLDELTQDEAALALNELHRVTNGGLFLIISRTDEIFERTRWEQLCFSAGWKKHASYHEVNPYQEYERFASHVLIPLSKIIDAHLRKYPLSALLQERDLHMDMLREAGRRSDGHVFRYHFAAQYIRPGDRVLDAACGLGYGSHILFKNGFAKSVVGVDLSKFAIDYATTIYGEEGLLYKQADVTYLEFLPDKSVDLIVSFETLEHVPSPESLLEEFARVLRPSGRIIVSVPNLWVDETGQDPNPWHFHVYDWNKLHAQLGKLFLIDEVFDQIAGGGFKLPEGKRLFRQKPLNDNSTLESEWCVAVAFCPSRTADIPFEETIYPYSTPPTNLLNFANAYENAWTIREICEPAFRLRDTTNLTERCRDILRQHPLTTADFGAALCVLGYRLLEGELTDTLELNNFNQLVTQYLGFDSINPHVHRWQVSLIYLQGVMCLRSGKHEESAHKFNDCIEKGFETFSPVLATKIVSAAKLTGIIWLSQKQFETAKKYFRIATQKMFDAIRAPEAEWIGHTETPQFCTYYDAMGLLDDGMFCATALSYLCTGYGQRLQFFRFLTSGGYLSSVQYTASQTHIEARQANQRHLSEINRLSKEHQELFDIAEARLTETIRLGKERQELFDIAEARLTETIRLGKERQELFDMAEARLTETIRLGRERQELFDIAEARYAELSKYKNEKPLQILRRLLHSILK